MSKENLKKWLFETPWLKKTMGSRESVRPIVKKKRFGPFLYIHYTPVERKIDRPSRTKLEAGILLTLLTLIALVFGGTMSFVSWNYRDVANGHKIWEMQMQMRDRAILKQGEYITILETDKANNWEAYEKEAKNSENWNRLYENEKADNEGLIIGYAHFLKVLNRETGKTWEIIPRPGKAPILVEKKVVGKDRKP